MKSILRNRRHELRVIFDINKTQRKLQFLPLKLSSRTLWLVSQLHFLLSFSLLLSLFIQSWSNRSRTRWGSLISLLMDHIMPQMLQMHILFKVILVNSSKLGRVGGVICFKTCSVVFKREILNSLSNERVGELNLADGMV